MKLSHEFVEYIPEKLNEGVVYISLKFGTVAHNCCCGCGNQAITPLSPTDWKIIFDGESISLYPSIGNWGFKCQSHYWIENNEVIWSYRWSKSQVAYSRKRDQMSKRKYYNDQTKSHKNKTKRSKSENEDGFWIKFMRILERKPEG